MYNNRMSYFKVDTKTLQAASGLKKSITQFNGMLPTAKELEKCLTKLGNAMRKVPQK